MKLINQTWLRLKFELQRHFYDARKEFSEPIDLLIFVTDNKR